MRARTAYAPRMHAGGLVLVSAAHPIAQTETGPTRVPVTIGGRTAELEARTANLLLRLFGDIRSGDEIVPADGYRSAAEQRRLYDAARAEHGEAFARAFVAPPGGSEHQTGLAIDLGRAAREIDFIRPDFPEEGACGRFRRLAPRYGFIQRYHREKESLTGIACEPWHYRYVGTPHALLMEREGLCLEEYLDWVQTAPRTCRLEHGRSARVFYMPCAGDETELRLPEGCCQVSGDNRNGFVVTVWEV